jgi:hypothetical protein
MVDKRKENKTYNVLTQKDIPGYPKWQKELYAYELNQMYPEYKFRNRPRKLISLAGTINPDPNRYRMVNNAEIRFEGSCNPRGDCSGGDHRGQRRRSERVGDTGSSTNPS